MNTENNGGAAFPSGEKYRSNDGVNIRDCSKAPLHQGMTLRNYFAAQAMQALTSGPEYGVNPTQGKDADWKAATARTAYELSDAMLEARKK